MKNIVRIFYKSDFSLQLQLPSGYDGQEFIIRVFTTDKSVYYEAKYNGEAYTNCTIDSENNVLNVYVNNHNLHDGCLHIMQAYDYANNHFADGVETLATIEDSNIYLVTSNPNSTSATFVGSALPDLTGSTDYVTKSDLEAASYVTSSALGQMSYITESDVSSMGYVTMDDVSAMGYITYIPAEYITQAELSACGYLTFIPKEYVTEKEIELMSYATQSYVADYVSTHGGSGYVDLSAYVTKTELNNAGYVTGQVLSQAGYVTSQALSQAGYITSIPAEYVTEGEIASMGYVTESELSSCGYITINDIPSVDLSSYVTKVELDNAGYATQSYVEQYVSSYAPSLDLSSYATKSYVGEYLHDMSYCPCVELLSYQYELLTYEEKTNGTIYVITDSAEIQCITYSDLSTYLEPYATKSYVANYVATYGGGGGSIDLSAYVTHTELSNAGYVTSQALSQAGYITSIPSEYITESEIASMSYATQTYVVDYVSQHGSSASVYSVTYAEYQNLINAGTYDPTTLYLITDGTLIDMSSYVTQASLSANAYLTYANFIYDSATNTLTISI